MSRKPSGHDRADEANQPPLDEFSTPRKDDPAARLDGAKGAAQDGADPASRWPASETDAPDAGEQAAAGGPSDGAPEPDGA